MNESEFNKQAVDKQTGKERIQGAAEIEEAIMKAIDSDLQESHYEEVMSSASNS